MIIAIQGQKGSFHEMAAQKLWADKINSFIFCNTFQEVFESIKDEKSDVGLVAIENSLYGSIRETYDLLTRYNFWIFNEITLQIHQQLISQMGLRLNEITEVHSHPVAFDQCRNWLTNNLPNAELVENYDTAGAVEFIAKNNSDNLAAIASKQAAKTHNMSIISSDIEDEKSNFTRFVALQKNKNTNKKINKASIILTTNHQPGALYKALGRLAEYEVNMTKLESRPVRQEKFKYQFIIDISVSPQILEKIIQNLESDGCKVKSLGKWYSSEL